MLFHVGEFESSKSAIKTSAPEFNALIIVFRSTGPVISTCLFCKSFGIEFITQLCSRISFVSSRNSNLCPKFNFSCTVTRFVKSCSIAAPNLSSNFAINSTQSRRKTISCDSVFGTGYCTISGLLKLTTLVVLSIKIVLLPLIL